MVSSVLLPAPLRPTRPMTYTRSTRIFVGETREKAVQDAEATYTYMRDNKAGTRSPNRTDIHSATVSAAAR